MSLLIKIFSKNRKRRLIVPLFVTVIFVVFIFHHLFVLGRFLQHAARFSEDELEPPPTSSDGLPRILIVSAMFPLVKSKHSAQEYNSWLSSFFRLSTPIYLFVPASFVPHLPQPLPAHVTINSSFDSPFDIPPLRGLRPLYEKQWLIDPEHQLHNPELYAVWSAKPYLLDEGLHNTVTKTGHPVDYAFWVDAGSFRFPESLYVRWPAAERVQQVWDRVGSKKSIFFPLFSVPNKKYRWWTEDMGPIEDRQAFSEGSFFGGQPTAISWFKEVYYAYHDYWISMGHFIGKDQSVFNALFLLFPDRFIGVWSDDPLSPAYFDTPSIFHHRWWRKMLRDWFRPTMPSRALGKCESEWYYYQYFLASREEREVLRNSWMNDPSLSDDWDAWLGGREDDRCRLTLPIKMDELLARESIFGPKWWAAERTTY